ncbi:MAG: HAD-IIIA family hydrolase [Candidatus Omnitrophica bacterium]|nr:HAD-IIIA family hydrolase [Candidatus Omnitrophota bacterium]
MRISKSQLRARAKKVQLLILDVDGVLTDRRIIVTSNGTQTKSFDVQDGFGLVMARKAGVRTAIITAGRSAVVTLRAQQLKVDWVAQFAQDKAKAFEDCLRHFRISPSAAGYVGDDLPDLPVLKRVGFSATVADGRPEVKPHVHYVTKAAGGRGAVREVVELILHAQGHWPQVVRRYLR